MADDRREELLASYADMGEAMVVQSVLEAGGVPCRVGDLARLPDHVLGLPGTLKRSVGLWVLEADAGRARELLATMGSIENRVDEASLAAEALASAPPPGAPWPRAPVPGRGTQPPARRAPSFWLGALGVLAGLVLVVLAGRCE